MTLNELAQLNVEAGREALGFKIKSLATGKAWEVSAKLRNGKFVIERDGDGKEAIVDGDADRYEMNNDAGRIEQIQARMAEIDTKTTELVTELDALDNEKENLDAELEELMAV